MAGAPVSDQCATSLQTLSAVCQALGFPMAEDKREGPSPCLEYLGILLDSQALEARLLRDKLEDIHISLREWATSRHCSKQELLSLVGTFSFAAKVVPPGRTFIRRMIDLSTTASSLQDTTPVSPEFRLDLEWWQAFATPWSGRSFFLLPDWTSYPNLQLYTDSSGTVGYGAYCQGEWFNSWWSPAQLGRSIQWKELFPNVLAASILGRWWSTL